MLNNAFPSHISNSLFETLDHSSGGGLGTQLLPTDGCRLRRAAPGEVRCADGAARPATLVPNGM